MKKAKFLLLALAIAMQMICFNVFAQTEDATCLPLMGSPEEQGHSESFKFDKSSSSMMLNNILSSTSTSVATIRPSQGAINVDITEAIEVTFDNPINPATVNNTTFIVSEEVNGTLQGTFTFSGSNSIVRFVPITPFKNGEVVKIIVSNRIQYSEGTAITPFTSQFTTTINRSLAKFSRFGSSVGVGEMPFSITVNDIDNDGDGDVVTANSSWGWSGGTNTSRTISVLKNNGDGSFANRADYITDTAKGMIDPWDVNVDDLNGDGFGDIVVANIKNQTISVLMNDGTGSFIFPAIYNAGGYVNAVKIYDIDGDGYKDIVASRGGIEYSNLVSSRYIVVLKNNGDGTFAAPIEYFAGYGTEGIDVYDLNGDGFGDIIASIRSWDNVVVLLNNGDGTFGSPAYYTTGDNPNQLYVSDLDGDGDGDIVVSNQIGYSITVLKNNGNGIFSNRQDYSSAGQPIGIFVADFDGDGDGDIIAANHYGSTYSISLWKNRGDGVFNNREEFDAGGLQPVAVYATDLDNDKDIDIAVANWRGNYFTILKNSIPGVSGIVFNDENSNGVQDSGENGIKDRLVQLEGGSQELYATTNSKGEYFFIAFPGTYNVRLTSKSNYRQTYPANSGVHNIIITSGSELKNINFGESAILLSQDSAEISTTINGMQHLGNSSCYDAIMNFCGSCTSSCVDKTYEITYKHANDDKEITNEDGCALTVTFPPGVQYDVDQVNNLPCPPNEFDGNLTTGLILRWTYICETDDEISQRGYTGCINASIRATNNPNPIVINTKIACCTPVTNPPVQLCATSVLTTNEEKVKITNSTECQAYIGPWMPSEKLKVVPIGSGVCKTIQSNDELTYMIGFQNVGNVPAKYVTIIDTLAYEYLDIPSVEVLQTSHPAEFEISGLGILTWTFNNINLPDSASNPEGSVGFIKFHVRLRSDIEPGDVIENKVAICFDINPPLITNTTINQIAGDSSKMATFETIQPNVCEKKFDFNYAYNLRDAQFNWYFGSGATPSTSTERNPKGIIYSTAGQKIVTLTVTTSCGCSATHSDTITVKETLPITGITPSRSTKFCQGEPINITLTANPANTNYLWSTGETTQSIIVHSAGTYTVNGCLNSSASITISVNPSPVVSVTSDKTTICNGDYVNLTASLKSNVLNSYNTCIFDYAGGDCNFTNSICKDAYTTNPGTKTSSPFSINEADSVLSIDFYVYWTGKVGNWTFQLNGTTIGSTGNLYSDTACYPISKGTYPSKFTFTNVNAYWRIGATNTLTVIPNAPIGYNGVAGYTATINYRVSSLPPYSSFTWNPTTGLNNPNIYNPVARPTTSTDYIVTGTDANGCSSTNHKLITVNPSPNVNAGNDVGICIGQSTILTASGAANYVWSNGLGAGNTKTVSPTLTTTYSVTGTDINGCSNNDQVVVTVNPLPIVNVTANNPTTFCQGDSVNLIATAKSIISNSYKMCIFDYAGGDCNFTNSICYDGYTTNPGTKTTSPFSINDATSVTSIDFYVYWTGKVGNWTFQLNGTTIGSTGSIISDTTCLPVSKGTYPSKFTFTNVNAYWHYGGTNTLTIISNAPVGYNGVAGYTATINYTSEITPTASFTWNPSAGLNNPNIYNPIAKPLTSTDYTVTATSFGCSGTNHILLNVNPSPNVNAGNDVSICQGQTTTLTASGAASYVWSNGLGAGNNKIVSPITTTTYSVTGTSANGCTNTDYVTVIVNPLPNVNAGNDVVICQGKSATINANGAISYTWNEGLGEGDSKTVSPASTTTYTVIGTDINGCTNTDNVTVTVNPLPNVSASNDVAICQGQSTAIFATGAETYVWNEGLGEGDSKTVSPISTTTYIVTGTDFNGCSNIDDVVVTIKSSPDVNAGNDVSICQGQSTTLTASGAVSYVWNNGLGEGNPKTVSPASTTTYTVIGTGVNGCTNTDEVTVTVNPSPNVYAGNDVAICQGQPTTLTASGALTYTWNEGLGEGDSKTVSPTSTTTYSVIGTDINGCTNTDNVTVTVNPLPNVLINASETTSCGGQSITLTASGANSYVWSNGAVTQSITVNPLVNTTYTVVGTNANGCSNTSAPINITVYPLLTANITVTPTPIQGANPNTIYIGYGTQCLVLTASSNRTVSYQWNTGETSSAITVCPVTTTTYTVTVTDANGCITTKEITINVVNIICEKGNKNKLHKVSICHIPPGNPENAHTICVDLNAVPAHLAHGDYLGECIGGKSELAGIEEENAMDAIYPISIYPNPASNYVIVEYDMPSSVDKFTLQITDLSGQILKVYDLTYGKEKVTIETSEFAAGVYFASVVVDGRTVNKKKLVLMK